jgi:hypothetical protein
MEMARGRIFRREPAVMKKAKQLRKRKVQLDNALEKRALGYVLAAASSCVAVLALGETSQAEVVYTPANQSIWANGGVLDLNNDGIVDFTFRPNYFSSHTSCAVARGYALYVLPAAPSNAIRGGGSALPGSILVGKNPQKFKQGQGTIAGWNDIDFFCSSRSLIEIFGQFANKANRYLGLQFSINGEIHYGWARFNVTDTGRRVSAVLTGYAYESNPNTPIFTGNEFGNELRDSPKPRTQAADGPVIPPADPATLGRLAQGAQGLAAWRVGAVAKPK